MRQRLLRGLGSTLGLALFVLALFALYHALKGYHYQDVANSIGAIPRQNILLALSLTALSYAVLVGYDALAFRYIAEPLDLGRIALASFVGNAFAHNLGLSLVSGGSVRYRLYSSWGLSAIQITNIVAFCTVSLWLGFLALCGVVFLAHPLLLPAQLHLPFTSIHAFGIACLVPPLGYLVWSLVSQGRLNIGDWTFNLPRWELAGQQILLAALDWVVASAVLIAVLPATPALSFVDLLAIFLLAQVAGVASQLPGGIGVFETVIMVFLTPHVPPTAVMGSLLIYRLIYYFLPLVVAAGLLGTVEMTARREGVKRLARLAGAWLPGLAPHIIAFLVFVAGALLLFSGATPTLDWRLAWLRKLVPLSLMEISHFVGSLAGVGLLLLARGLQRRLDGAYHLTLALLAVGIVVSLLKGVDYEEAVTLALVLAVLLPCHRLFYREALLTNQRFTFGWVVAIILVLLGAIWLGLFSYQYVQYSDELWWRFTFSGDAPRFLRATVGAVGLAVFFGIARLLRPAPAAPPLPGPAELDRAETIIRNAPRSSAHLALMGDKPLLFSTSGQAFLMYGVQGKAWVAMGDPVGPREEWPELIWHFRELGDRHDAWTVFYQVPAESLPLYLELGLTLLKIGEEARVDLTAFSMEGGARKKQRHLLRQVDQAGVSFDILTPDQVPAALPRLRRISEAWLAHKQAREKRFSLGYFEPHYLARLPIAVARQDGDIVAFANLWGAGDRAELSVDLMRYLPDAPEGIMEYLFLKLILWGQEQRYRWLNLGMAPLAGLDDRALASLWSKLGAMVFRHGEHFYNFQGLRQYKTKFDPVWTPRYLAAPGGTALPRVLTLIASLIASAPRAVAVK